MPAKNSRLTMRRTRNCPAALFLASSPEQMTISGKYDKNSQTWSNRKFETAAEKKHHESM